MSSDSYFSNARQAIDIAARILANRAKREIYIAKLQQSKKEV